MSRGVLVVATMLGLSGCTAAEWAAAFAPQPGYQYQPQPTYQQTYQQPSYQAGQQCLWCKGHFPNVFEHQRATGCTAGRPGGAQQQPAYQPPPTYQQPTYQQPRPAQGNSGMAPDAWAQTAITRLQRGLSNRNFSQTLANGIQAYTHPSGNSASMAQGLVGRAMGSMSRVVVTLTVNWRGGVVGSQYRTQVQWVFSQSGQESVTITGDNAPVAVAESNRAQLENYFRQNYEELKLQIR